ncbi:hypothetical protein E2C01_079881 [Portunus trituberculatus]|uniref:Uncharacterized protein n=1 Tax=Portunus trituberculatus TaxID=210409 RepID=A0A5B7II14_PORTR|nr:hypothetical protein [Portunus trituberculatus]
MCEHVLTKRAQSILLATCNFSCILTYSKTSLDERL